MKQNLLRINFVSLAAFLFLTVLFYPQQEPKQISINQRPSVKVKTKVVQKQEPVKAEIQTAQVVVKEQKIVEKPLEDEKTKQEQSVQSDEIQQEVTDFDLYFDLDSTNQPITAPIIDLKSVYSKINYPISMKKKNIQASFDVKVYVSKNGDVTINIPQDVQKAFSDTVLKAFNGIRAIPAQYKGKNVDVTFSIPMVFELK